MSPRPFVSFAEVKTKVSIPDVLEVLGIADQFTEKNGVYTGCCVFPKHIHGAHPNTEQFKINEKDGIWLWQCFGDCKAGGDVIEFVKTMQELSDSHVRFFFAEHFGDRLTLRKKEKKQTSSGDKKPENEKEGIKGLQTLRFYLDLDGDVAYLRERGINSSTIERYGIGFCSKGVLDGYVAMPVYRWPKQAEDENPVGYIGRYPGDDYNAGEGRPRYKLPSGFGASRVIYGLEQALSEENDSLPLIVVEGPFKVFHLVQHGFTTAVSTLTSSVSDEQADILLQTKRPIVLLFDGNEAGIAGMRKAAGKLISGTYVRVVRLVEGQEPDHLSGEELKKVLHFV